MRVGVDVAERLEIRRGHARVLRVVAADVHVDVVAPVAAVADAAAIVRRDDDIALLQQVLMKLVVHGFVAVRVPAVVVLVHAVRMNPHDGRVLLRAIEILAARTATPAPLAVGSRIVNQLRRDELRLVDARRHRRRQARRPSRWRRRRRRRGRRNSARRCAERGDACRRATTAGPCSCRCRTSRSTIVAVAGSSPIVANSM